MSIFVLGYSVYKGCDLPVGVYIFCDIGVKLTCGGIGGPGDEASTTRGMVSLGA